MCEISKKERERRANKAERMRVVMFSPRYVGRLVRHVREQDASAPSYPYYSCGKYSPKWPEELYK